MKAPLSAATSPTLALAEQRIAAAERLIARHQRHLEDLHRRGAVAEAAAAEDLLRFFHETLDEARATRARLLGEAA